MSTTRDEHVRRAIGLRAVDGPTHLLASAGDRFALCGEREPLPRLVARFLGRHREGHARAGLPMFEVCADCLRTVAK